MIFFFTTYKKTILTILIVIYFQLHLLHDECPRVCIFAIHTINNCLKLIQTVPPSDANIFPEYILPALTPVDDFLNVDDIL